MTMKRFATAITPAAQVGAMHQDLIQALGYADLSEPLKECAQLADKAFAENFAAQAGPESGPWPARKAHGSGQIGDADQGHPLEIKSGELFLAVTSPFGAGHIEDVGNRSAELGVDPNEIPYAMAQNYGRPDANLPQREFEDLTEEEKQQCDEIIADAMLQELLNA
ncbi:MAG: hypothetical protein KGL35_18730 [Bradyrhizobium sp.]|nr:hypothetical protein [Bradyrhizobium sp.]